MDLLDGDNKICRGLIFNRGRICWGADLYGTRSGSDRGRKRCGLDQLKLKGTSFRECEADLLGEGGADLLKVGGVDLIGK